MELENTLAKNITSAGENAAYDAACKKLLANKSVLAWIMKSCMEEYRDCEIQDIISKYIEGEPQITYDVRFYAVAPSSGELISLIINVEAQNDFYPGYPIVKRGLYYCSRMVSSQYGTEFTNSHYEKIKKVYSIWICMNPPKYRKNTINRYSIQEEQLVGNVVEKAADYDIMTAVMICLGDLEDQSSGVLKLLEVLFSSEREVDEKK